MKVKDLFPNPENPRKISNEKQKMLAASIENFGDLSGIVFNRKSQKLVSGHQRIKLFSADTSIVISRKLKKPSKQGTVAEGFIVHDGEAHKYREVEFDELTEKAANLTANTQFSKWDSNQRIEWLTELDAENYPLEMTGLTESELENLVAPIEFETKKERKELSVRQGDSWNLGHHQIVVGKNPKEAEIAINAWQDYTGKTAERIKPKTILRKNVQKTPR